MRIICAEFYDSISITITTHGRIDHWSETLHRHEKSNLRQRAKSSPYHKSAACITGISGQLEAGSVNMFPNTDRRQIHPQESAWRDQVDSSE
jgi:hypothetical protein